MRFKLKDVGGPAREPACARFPNLIGDWPIIRRRESLEGFSRVDV